MTQSKRVLAGVAALLLGACANYGVEYVELADGVRALQRPGSDEPFRIEMQVNDSVRWYEAVRVSGNRYVLTNRGEANYIQDETRGDLWPL